jgi:hypothetical protein
MRAAVDTGHGVKQVLQLVRDEKLRKHLGTRGKMHMCEYDAQHLVDAWDMIFSNLMNKPAPLQSNSLYTTVI